MGSWRECSWTCELGGGVVFHEVCDDLEREGYEVQPFLIPAASVNAPHQRQRIWFIAYSNNKGRSKGCKEISKEDGEIFQRNKNAKFSNTGIGVWSKFPVKSPICGGDDGIPRKLDSITFPKWRNESIKAYGNAIVPQVAYEIFKAIQSFEDMVNV